MKTKDEIFGELFICETLLKNMENELSELIKIMPVYVPDYSKGGAGELIKIIDTLYAKIEILKWVLEC